MVPNGLSFVGFIIAPNYCQGNLIQKGNDKGLRD